MSLILPNNISYFQPFHNFNEQLFQNFILKNVNLFQVKTQLSMYVKAIAQISVYIIILLFEIHNVFNFIILQTNRVIRCNRKKLSLNRLKTHEITNMSNK